MSTSTKKFALKTIIASICLIVATSVCTYILKASPEEIAFFGEKVANFLISIAIIGAILFTAYRIDRG